MPGKHVVIDIKEPSSDITSSRFISETDVD